MRDFINFAFARCLLVMALSACGLFSACHPVMAQYPTVLGQDGANLFDRSALTSPEVGRLEGIQRFGEALRTDPDPGIGYTYRVFPPAEQRAMDQESFLWAFAHLGEAYQLKNAYRNLAAAIELRRKPPSQREETDAELDRSIQDLQSQVASLQLLLNLALGGEKSVDYFTRYATARDTTSGLRVPFSSNLRSSAMASFDPAYGAYADVAAVAPAGFGASANLFDDSADGLGPIKENLFHQPLIQIKVRIVEAARQHSTDFRSVLDYISRRGTASAFVAGNNINNNNRSTRAATVLPSGRDVLDIMSPTPPMMATKTLADLTASGSGGLINLTTEHLNFITNMLVTEFEGDVLTVPEVVTLNGQNVEFVAGENRPLPLGLTLVQGNGTVRQDVFYKHIGTLVSITPRIVNWGRHLEGAGEAPIVAQEVNDWNRLAKWMIDDRNIIMKDLDPNVLARYAWPAKLPIPVDLKRNMLAELEDYSAKTLRTAFGRLDPRKADDSLVAEGAQEMLQVEELPIPESEYFGQPDAPPMVGEKQEELQPILREPFGIACDWKPENCTIDLEILVRNSDLDGNNELDNSIANIIQVKSGHGAVMGGLIGSSEIASVSKIPLLGDLPGVGYFFRSKSVDRAKSELLIFVEARVLPPGEAGREESAQDFQLSKAYVDGPLRENPLEAGMCKAGFGPYLPPSCPPEEEFWMEHQQKLRKVATEVDDIFR